ncbi:MAG: 3'-5' exonuclease [Rhodospirillaceae bacterium]
MQHQNLFVFDIETIPATDAVKNLTGFDGRGTQALREELTRYHLEITDGRNDFHRQPFHRVVAISFLEAEIDRTGGGETYILKELRSGGEANFDEKRLLQGFFTYFERIRPRLVSFNGRGFDLPVLKYRAMAHGVQAPLLHDTSNKWENYTARYSTDWHCDLMEALSDFGASARIKLNEVCSILGLPGKFGVDGSNVAGMYDDGRIKEIRDYCETDVLNTYLVYLRYQHHRRVLTTEAHDRAVADVISLIEAKGGERPHLNQFLDAWGEASGNKFLLSG